LRSQIPLAFSVGGGEDKELRVRRGIKKAIEDDGAVVCRSGEGSRRKANHYDAGKATETSTPERGKRGGTLREIGSALSILMTPSRPPKEGTKRKVRRKKGGRYVGNGNEGTWTPLNSSGSPIKNVSKMKGEVRDERKNLHSKGTIERARRRRGARWRRGPDRTRRGRGFTCNRTNQRVLDREGGGPRTPWGELH